MKSYNLEFSKAISYLKFILFFSSILFIINSVSTNLDYVYKLFEANFEDIFFLLIITFITQIIISFRTFDILKKIIKGKFNFSQWSFLFFYTSILNDFLILSGHIFRSIELKKKKNISYTRYTILYIFINYLHFLINFFFIFLVLGLILKNNILVFFLLFITLILIYLFISLKINFFFKKILFFFKKSFNIKFSTIIINNLLFMNKLIVKRNWLIFCVTTILVILCNFSVFKIIFLNIFGEETAKNILIFFSIHFILNVTPLVSNIPGLREVIFGLSAKFMGYFLIEGLIFQIVFRIIYWVCLMMNTIIFYFFDRK
jgi:hypothetical protein